MSGAPAEAGSEFTRLLWRHRGDRRAVPALLRAAQQEQGWIGRERLDLIARFTDLAAAELARELARRMGLRLEPAGRHLVQTCLGLACHLRGAAALREALAVELGVGPGQTTADGLLTWEEVPCLGACALAPALALDGGVHGPLDRVAVHRLVAAVRAGEAPAAPPRSLHAATGGRLVVLAGCVRRPGTVAVPPGSNLGEVVQRLGGGTPTEAPLKAVLCGGRLVRDPRALLPALIGSAQDAPPRLVVLDERVCAVDIACHLLAQAADASCGRCALGHFGSRRLAELAGSVRRGPGMEGALAELTDLAGVVARGARCAACRAPAALVREGLLAFFEEHEVHARSGCCLVGSCRREP
jgi:NADH:ubiquinone oxidoreductase subunit E